MQRTLSGKAGQFKTAATGGGRTGVNSGNGWGHGFMHGHNNGNGGGSRDTLGPEKWVPMSVSQLSLLCQVMGDDP